MTRINCIPVEELHDRHLVAEYRELPRVFALAKKSFLRGEDPGTFPRQYTLGTGHVRFFYDKLGYLYSRQLQLIREMERRGFNPQHKNPFPLVHEMISLTNCEWTQEWTPNEYDMAVNRARINERLEGMKNGNTSRVRHSS